MNNDSNPLTENEEHDIPSQIIWRPFLDSTPQLFLDPNMCGFQYIWEVLWYPWYQTLVVNWQN